ncbi:QacE family quaternary ammonium compound efflux SMR transporter [Arthrobacter crusticola]|uniref:QacE family quaternary ammonium compound efflux SMR transporter n=1 Tax=Arthrobacter crusticola TaxID=2547960 RepID=A0A4V3ALQ4_9MICC|nr:SMR family transporter [Arthrobacter crusticola]TDK23936.1 QacE family quaternary ammonium compound efflux SMR transporter [Arthrobacter crusticola]
MAWVVLIISGILEAVWATTLAKTEGFTKVLPSIIFGASFILSMAGLTYALKTLPVGTSYAVWVGTGATLTAAYAMFFGGESASIVKVILLLGIVGCIVGLKLTD